MEETNIHKSIQNKASERYNLKETKLNKLKYLSYKITNDDS